MATIDLRFEQRGKLEEMPGVCIYCGEPVLHLTEVSTRTTTVHLPLCRDHTDRARDVRDNVLGALDRVFMDGAAAGGGLVGMGVGMIGEVARERDRQEFPTIRLDGVDPEFIRELNRVRRRNAREWERKVIEGHPDAKQRTKPEEGEAFTGIADDRHKAWKPRHHRHRGIPPWVIALCVGAGLVLAGLVTVGVIIYKVSRPPPPKAVLLEAAPIHRR